MASEKPTMILLSKSDMSKEQISTLSDAEAWKIIYSIRTVKAKDARLQVCFTGFGTSKKQELIDLAKDMKAADRRGEEIGLTEDELAFYDALEVNDSAVKVLGDDTLKVIARELVETVRKNATIDWTVRENARARLCTMVKRLLRKHGYPPDKQEKATKMVLQQAEAIAKDWTP